MVVLTATFQRGGRAGGDKRGNSAQRRARKLWLLSPSAGFGGTGTTVPCIYGCGTTLSFDTVEADRILAGGSYGRHNVIPACRACNVARLDKTVWQFAPNVARRLIRMGKVVSPRKAG